MRLQNFQVEKSPFVERLLKKGYEILYLVEAVDEYALSSLPEFEGKKFQNVAKEGLSLSKDKKKLEELQKDYEPLTKWLTESALKDMVRPFNLCTSCSAVGWILSFMNDHP